MAEQSKGWGDYILDVLGMGADVGKTYINAQNQKETILGTTKEETQLSPYMNAKTLFFGAVGILGLVVGYKVIKKILK